MSFFLHVLLENLFLRKKNNFSIWKVNASFDEESVYNTLVYEQEKIAEIFSVLSCNKIKVDTSEERWEIMCVKSLKKQDINIIRAQLNYQK